MYQKLNQIGAIINSPNHVNVYKQRIYLQDMRLDAIHQGQASQDIQSWIDVISELMPEADRKLLSSRLVMVDDETMTFLWETATQVDARNRLNQQGTAVDGALWYEESLPPETILIGQMAAEQSRRKAVSLSPDDVLKKALPANSSQVIQVGGKATVGRGICSIYSTVAQTAELGRPSMLNLDQRRAYHAYSCVSQVAAGDLKEYKILVNGLGPNIIRSGLVAALAFLQRYRSAAVKEKFAHHIASGLPEEWETPHDLDGLIAYVRVVDNMQYMLITREIMRLTLWFKRAIQASDQTFVEGREQS